MLMTQLVPWTNDDLSNPERRNLLDAQIARSGPPLSVVEFDKALRYIVNSAGKPGSEAAVNRAADLVAMVVRLVDKPNVPETFLRSVFTALKVLSASDIIGMVAIQKAIHGMAAAVPVPLLYMRFLHEATRQNRNLGQFVCTQIMPMLVANRIWGEQERWKGFILLAKRYSVAQPPHCLPVLLQLGAQQLREVLAIAPDAQGVLAAFVTSAGAAGRLHGEVRELLGV